MTAALFQHVGKTFRSGIFRSESLVALQDVSLEIPQGIVFGLLGPNRAGKTTLVKLLLSLSRLSTGTISRLGEPISNRSTLARIGYMHENHAFPRYLSAGEVLSFYGGLTRVDSAQLDVRIPALLERVGLADRNREPISRFSKGMVQRLGLAQAVINEPDLLILDEPTEGLDLLGRQLLKDIVREYRAAGKTVILVSHALAEVEELCDRAAVLVQGRVAFEGTLPELRSQVNGSSATLELALRSLYTQAQTPTVAR